MALSQAAALTIVQQWQKLLREWVKKKQKNLSKYLQ